MKYFELFAIFTIFFFVSISFHYSMPPSPSPTQPSTQAQAHRKKAQDAHEAIRPTSVDHIPDELAPHLSEDQLALYRLIWQRFVASQMSQALINQVSVTIAAGAYQFAASGSTIKFPGFMAL